jgi:hypothetical protein
MISNQLIAGFGNYRKKTRINVNELNEMKNYDEWVNRFRLFTSIQENWIIYDKYLIHFYSQLYFIFVIPAPYLISKNV